MAAHPGERLAGRRILLAGASGGIGRCIADSLTRAGATVLLADRDGDALRALGDELRQAFIAVDLTADGERERLMQFIESSWSALDGLVNCAGVTTFGLQDAITDTQVRRMIEVNLTMPILLTRRLLPLLEAGQQPVIVNLGSVFGHIGFPGFATYSASKFGLHGFSEALRRELAGSPVRVAWISPRATRTAMNAGAVDAMNAELGVRYDGPEAVATAVTRALTRPRRDRVLGFPEKLFARLNQVFPSLVDHALRSQLAIVRKYSNRQKEMIS